MKITIAVTGASGAIYARQLIQSLSADECVEQINLIFTRNGLDVMKYEQGIDWLDLLPKITRLENDDFFTSVASGSSAADAMVVIPCSAGMMSRIACGISDDLTSRAADVMLKERRKLILVLRETPLNVIHIQNMKTVTDAGAIILPASPSFYHKPSSIEDLCRSVTDRVLDLTGIPSNGFRWR